MRKILFATNVLLCLILFLVVGALGYPISDKLIVRVLDIGQGDAILLTLPSQHTVLIDGGPDHSIVEKLGDYLPFWERSIDALVVTHPHEDHLLGALDVLDSYSVKNIVSNPVMDEKNSSYTAWAKQRQKHVDWTLDTINSIRANNEKLSIDFFRGVTPSKNQNNNSIVTLVSMGSIRFLLMGDAENELEEELFITANQFTFPVDVIKVGHHGSKTSSSEEFLSAMQPQIGIISCGTQNKFGHPFPTTLERFQQYGIPVERTDQKGTISIITDGETMEVLTEREEII